MTFIHEAIRAAEQWAARLPKLPVTDGPAVDVAAQLRDATAARDERARQIIVVIQDNQNDR